MEIDIVKEFKSRKGRSQRFSIYVPDQDRNGAQVDRDKWVEESLHLLSEICGGATQMPPVRGAWLNPDSDKLVSEHPVIVYSFIDPASFKANISKVVDLVHRIGRETNQGQMAIEFNNVLYLIDMPGEGGSNGAAQVDGS